MARVIIKRCTLRIVRRGGWTWGPDPALLLNGALRALRIMVARKLAEVLSRSATDGEVSRSRLSIAVRISELLELSGTFGSSPGPGANKSNLESRIERALEQALATFPSEAREHEENGDRDAAPEEPPRELRWAGTVLRVLIGWREEGVLASHLASFSIDSLEAWHASLLEARTTSVAAPPEIGPAIERLLSAPELNALTGSATRATVLQRRLIAITEAVRQLNVAPSDPVLLAALDRRLPLAGEISESPQAELPDSETTFPPTPPSIRGEARMDAGEEPARRSRASTLRSPGLAQKSAPRADFKVESALPFLLLGPLSKMGYLKALEAVLEAAGLIEDAPLFATALAFKVLEAPERGWRRSAAASHSASIFAGLAEALPEAALGGFSCRIAALVSPLDSVISQSILEGHDHRKPVMLYKTPTPPGLLLVDSEGCFVIGWSGEIDGLKPALTRLTPGLILVPASTASESLLARLEAHGCRFVTDAPPTRRERWRRLRHGGARLWTNDENAKDAWLVRMSEGMENVSERTRRLWESLMKRPGVPLAEDPHLEISLSLAAATALATLSWTLWREREATDPLLSLNRFADLDGQVRFEQDTVRVRLPLGRRYRELFDCGLLSDVRSVPWLPGRTVSFAWG
jgi:hypothetical protein